MNKTRREQQKEQTKALLVKTAYHVFSEKGIMNTRVSDIAQAAGVSHGAVFVHFKSLEALTEEVIETYGEKITARTHILAESSGNLTTLLRAHLEGIMEFEPFYTRLVIENRLLPVGARDTFISIQSAISLHFSEVVQREFDPDGARDIPLHMLFNIWIGLTHHYLANGDLFSPEGNVIRRYGDTLIETFIKLIGRPTKN